MNLKEYLESDIIDFELIDGVIEEYKKIFTGVKCGIRNFTNQAAGYLINYDNKEVTMVSVFEENFHELKAFKLICEHFNFKFKVSLLDFVNLPMQDNIIQTLKWMVVTEEIIKNKKYKKDSKQSYQKLINSKKIIEEAKRRFVAFCKIKNLKTNIPLVINNKCLY